MGRAGAARFIYSCWLILPVVSVACSDGFSVPALAHAGRGMLAAPPLPPHGCQELPTRVRLPGLPRLSVHRSPAARLPRGAGNHIQLRRK